MKEDVNDTQREIFANKLAECGMQTGYITLSDDGQTAILDVVALTPKKLRCVADAIELSSNPTALKTGKVLSELETCCELNGSIDIGWSVEGIGFGHFYFYEKDGEIHCDNEIMSKEFIKKVLCDFVDQCVLDDPR